jgi:hypothetical protein
VRQLGERLRSAGLEVRLDQFFLDQHPGGPDDGWDKWSSDSALLSERVLIVGTRDWFECFDKRQTPGTGLGAGCEADDLRHRIYEAGGVIEGIRVVLFDDADAQYIPAKLRRYHRFHAERDFDSIRRWVSGASEMPAVGQQRSEGSSPSATETYDATLPASHGDHGLVCLASQLDPSTDNGTARNPPMTPTNAKRGSRLEIFLAFSFGFAFCGILAFIVLRGTPITDPALIFVLRVLTALSAAAVVAVIPGFIDLNLATRTVLGVRAGGAIVVFVLVFAANPPELVQSNQARAEAAMLANKAAGLYEDADRSADGLLQNNGRHGLALNTKGSVAFYRGDYRKAVEYFERAVEVNRKPAWVSNLAYAYIETGAYLKAIDALLSINDGKPDWYFSIGRAYLYAGDYSKARKDLQAVPTTFWHGAGRVLEAASIVGLAQAADPQQRSVLMAEAKKQLGEGIQQDPDYWRGILRGTRTDIHLGYTKPRELLADIANESL